MLLVLGLWLILSPLECSSWRVYIALSSQGASNETAFVQAGRGLATVEATELASRGHLIIVVLLPSCDET